MRVTVYPPTGVHGFGRTRTVGVIAHPLTGDEAADICAHLDQCGICIVCTRDERNTVHLWPNRPLTTAEEVTVLAAVLARTDSRIAWHAAVA